MRLHPEEDFPQRSIVDIAEGHRREHAGADLAARVDKDHLVPGIAAEKSRLSKWPR